MKIKLRKVIPILLGGAILMVGCSGSASDDKAFNARFFNPVKDDPQLGDPFIVRHNDGNYYYTQSGGHHVVIRKAETITGISAGEEKEIWNISSQKGLDQVWAPELHFYGGRWYCYFTARQNATDELRRIFVLQSRTEDAMGEWDFIGKMELPDDQWAIDATFMEREGRLFLLWSGWADISDGPGVWRQHIYICELESPTSVMPGTQRVKLSSPEYAWETVEFPQNEGPQILKSPGGNLFCIYSASFSKSDSYCLGQLELTGDPMNAGDWTKSAEPVFSSNPEERVYSPGHCSFTQSPDGSEHWIMYHAAKDSRTGWDRSARIQRFDFDGNGVPVFGKPRSTNLLYDIPSGEKVSRLLYEAEDAELIQAEQSAHPGASGQSSVRLPESGSEITFRITVPEARDYPLYIRYSNTMPMRSRGIFCVNGGPDTELQFQRCAISGASESDMGMTVIRVPLEAGENTVTFSGTRAVAFDCVAVETN